MDLGNQPETQSPGCQPVKVPHTVRTPRSRAPLAAQRGGVNGACVRGTLWHRVSEEVAQRGVGGPTGPAAWVTPLSQDGLPGGGAQRVGSPGSCRRAPEPLGSRALTGLVQPLARRGPCLQSARRAAWVSPSKELRAHGTACLGQEPGDRPSSESCGAHASGDAAPRQPTSDGTGSPLHALSR